MLEAARYLIDMDINRALALANQADLGRTYVAAVAHGGRETGCTAEEERAHGALGLLTLSLVRMPDLALCAYALDQADDGSELAGLARTAAEVAAGTLRLASRALEVHGRDVGYKTDAWLERARLQAGAELATPAASCDRGVPVALGSVRCATVSLACAAAATAGEPMQVPEQVTDALGQLLVLYTLAAVEAR